MFTWWEVGLILALYTPVVIGVWEIGKGSRR